MICSHNFFENLKGREYEDAAAASIQSNFLSEIHENARDCSLMVVVKQVNPDIEGDATCVVEHNKYLSPATIELHVCGGIL